MDRLDKPQGDLKRANFSFEIEQATGKDVLQVVELAYSFDNSRRLFQHVSFQLSRGDIAALIGPNGIGKSTILKILMEQYAPAYGTFKWGANVKIGYYDQEQGTLNPQSSVLDEVWNAYPHLEESRIRTVLGNFLFSGEDVFKKVSSLSGGEKARVALAKLMLLNANVLILDEPTNHLDLYSKEVLESSLLDYEGTLLFISHDRYFLNKMAERILELSPNGVESYLGNYDDYNDKKQEMAEIQLEKEAAVAKKTSGTLTEKPSGYEADKLAKREERTKQRKLEQIEADIARFETEVSALELELTQPGVYNDYLLVQEKNAGIDTKKNALQQLYADWEVLLADS
jgi:ATP-binding cassette subfamily F protein 3